MSLPKIAQVTHELIVPSTGKKIKFRPFLVKEEKVLILARESQNQAEMIRAIKDVISACVMTRGFKVEELATFDIEYIFISIRSRSVGEDVEVVVTCPDDGETKVDVSIFLGDIGVVFDENHSTKIKLDDQYGLLMKYPTMEMIMDADVDNVTVDQTIELIASCIDQVYTEEDSFAASDSTKEELIEWVENLHPTQFEAVEQFFVTMPKLSHTIEVLNPKTGVKNEIVLEGMGSFLA